MNADPNAAPANDNPAAVAAPAVDAATSFERAKLIALLGLAENATDAEIEGAIKDLMAKAASGATEIATAQTSLQTIQAERDALQAKYDELWQKQQDLDKRQREAEADAALSAVKDKIPADKFTQLRDLFLSNPQAAELSISLLNSAMVAGAPGGVEMPPRPTHDPENANGNGPSEEEIAKAISARTKELQAGNPQLSYGAAQQQAEGEIRNKVAAGQSI